MQKQKRNLVFITTDQQRFDSLPCYGAAFSIAPNLERLAADGVVFEKCYVPAPVCVPTRASIMSGRFPSAHGVIDNFSWLPANTGTWIQAATDAGYRTAGIGKMHFSPWDAMFGFGQRIICEDKRHFYIPDDHAQFMESRGVTRPHPKDMAGYFESCGAPDFPYDEELYADRYIADRSVSWIQAHAHDPFVLWVSFVGPHDPYDPPPEYSKRYENAAIPAPIPAPADPSRAPSFRAQKQVQPGVENSVFRIDSTKATPEQIAQWRKHYFGNVTLIDEGIGRIVASLESAGVLDNTVIVFTSDHGDALGDHGMVFKSFFYEPMVHVPLIVYDGVNRGRREALTGTLDVVAYMCEVLQLDSAEPVQGHSIGPVLENSGVRINDFVFSEMPDRVMVFDGRHKYIHAADGEHELYDHDSDPTEQTNIIDRSSAAEKIATLRGALISHQMRSTVRYGQSRRSVAYPLRAEMEREYRESISRS